MFKNPAINALGASAYFFYQPLMLFIGGKKKEAIGLFLKTVAMFGVMTVVVLGLFFMGLI